MKTNFTLAALVLLILGIGGSVLGYHTAVNKVHAHEAKAEPANAADAAGGGAAAPATSDASTAADAGGADTAASGAAASGAAAGDGTTMTAEVGTASGDATAAGAGTAQQQEDANVTAAAEGEGDAAAGQTTFAGTCGGCHGPQAQGAVGPNLAPVAAWSFPDFQKAVREGEAPDGPLEAMMPHFSEAQVSDGDLNNIYAWIKTLK